MTTGIIFLFILSSCSNIRHLPESEKLYTGANVKIIAEGEIKDKNFLRKEALKVVRPQPNRTVFGLRIRLWFYNVAGTPTGKGFRYFLKNKLGEPPVLFSTVNPTQVSDMTETRMFNKGVFRAVTTFKINETEKKASVEYNITAHERYTIDTIKWPDADDDIRREIRSISDKSKLLNRVNYDLDLLTEERARIDDHLKDRGYYYFDPDYILFSADTNNDNKSITIRVRLKDNIPNEATLVYRLNKIFLIPDYSIKEGEQFQQKDTLIIDNVYYIAADKSYRPRTILRSVFLHEGEIYTRRNHNMTLSRLMGMGVFKFVNIRFIDQDSLAPGFLNAGIYLTPLPRKSVRMEVEMVSKSNNFLGPTVSVGYSNRNALNGAELLVINMHGSFETQLNGQYKGLFSYEIGPEISLYVPRFIVPFGLKSRRSYFLPKTRFTIGYDYLKRVQYYDLNSYKFIFGYKWKETLLKEHEFNPVYINHVRIQNMTPQFSQMLDANALLRRSFEDQFILGMTYSYTYNEQLLEKKRNPTYLNVNVETSGNAASLINNIFSDEKINPDNPVQITGSVYSQYVRTDFDLRHFRKLTPHTKLAGRLYAGIGYSYENSTTLPYVKQFYSGGVSSVRAFRARALGPGVYVRNDSTSLNFYFEQGGDIKLESNIEYRFDIISLLKGALFVDAGNMWLMRPNPALPGGTFNGSKFLSEIAVGTGFGIRLDANFFVLRLDVAFPIRKPWFSVGERWVFRQVRPWSSEWKKENLLFNLAIGYPF